MPILDFLTEEQALQHDVQVSELALLDPTVLRQRLRSTIQEMVIRIQGETQDDRLGDIEPFIEPAGLLARALGYATPPVRFVRDRVQDGGQTNDWLNVRPVYSENLRAGSPEIELLLGFRFSDPLPGAGSLECLRMAVAARDTEDQTEVYLPWAAWSQRGSRQAAVAMLERWIRHLDEASLQFLPPTSGEATRECVSVVTLPSPPGAGPGQQPHRLPPAAGEGLSGHVPAVTTPSPPGAGSDQQKRLPEVPTIAVPLTEAAKWFRCSVPTLKKEIAAGRRRANQLTPNRWAFDLEEVADTSPLMKADADPEKQAAKNVSKQQRSNTNANDRARTAR